MGQLAFSDDRGDSPSIAELRQLITDLDNYGKLLKEIGDQPPAVSTLRPIIKPLSGFEEKIETLRVRLGEDGENCIELEQAILQVKHNFIEKKILAKLSVYIRRLARIEGPPTIEISMSDEIDLEDLRIQIKKLILNLAQDLSQAVDNRCYPDVQQM
jgi:hypothetical protein